MGLSMAWQQVRLHAAGGISLSHTQADQPWAEWIAWVLEEDGHRVLVQAWDFVPGTNWVQGMQAGPGRGHVPSQAVSRLPDVGVWRDGVAGSVGQDPQGTGRKLLTIG